MHPLFDMSSDYCNSPAIFYPPASQHFFPSDHVLQSPLSQWTPAPVASKASSAPPKRPTLATNPSRKRSREDFDDDYDTPALTGSSSSSDGLVGMDVVVEPVMGEGMTLIDPVTGRALSAESQTGTWYEDNLEAERQAAARAAAELEKERLEARGRPTKAVRLASSGPAATSVSDNNNNIAAAAPLLEQPLAATPEPTIDEASMLLGIGWKAVSTEDPDMQCAVRGWARYIENHYPLLGAVEMLCKSEGLEAYLVKASQPQEGYWLFKEDLSEGRLVTTSTETVVERLRAVPVVFEGAESLYATERTPYGSAGETAWSIPQQPEQQQQQSQWGTASLSHQSAQMAVGASDAMVFE